MNAPTDTATLQEPTDRAEIHGDGTVIVEYTKTEAALADLRARYKGIAFDLTTTKGDKEARAARLELVTLRTTLEKKRKAFKSPAIEFGKKIDAEAQRITAEIEALETPIDEQIRADEARREAEKEAKREAEAARVRGHLEAIGKIRNWVTLAQGLPAERLAKGMAALSLMTFGDECEDHKPQYEAARNETLDALCKMHFDAVTREEEAKRLEAQRLEQERVAAELAKQQDEINRQRAELERQQREIIEAAEAERAEQARRSQEAIDAAKTMADRINAGQAPVGGVIGNMAPRPTPAESQQADTAIHQTDPGMVMTGCTLTDALTRKDTTAQQEAGQAATQGTEANPSPCQAQTSLPEPTIKLGEIGKRLGFVLTESFIRDALHIERCGNDKSAVLFKASDFARICQALINHLGRLA